MKVEYISEIINNTKDAFLSLVKMTVEEKKPVVIKETKENEYNVNLVSEGDLVGSIILSVNNDVAVMITKSFIKEGNVEESDIKEVLGELVTKIAKTTKKSIRQKKMILSKEKFTKNNIPFEKDVSYVEIPFVINEGSFSVIAGFEDNIKADAT